MSSGPTTIQHLEELSKMAPAGFALALHIGFTSPKYLLQTYPEEWSRVYAEQGLVLQDPTVHWGFGPGGQIRWSALADKDASGVLARAATFGLTYGCTTSLMQGGSRSLGSFARSDREFTDEEMTAMAERVADLHKTTLTAETFSPAVHRALMQMSVRLSQG